MKIIKAILLIAILLLNAWPVSGQQSEEFFPLSQGNYWIYKGTVRWGEGKGESKKIKWKMEVIKRVKNGLYEIAVMKGHPDDLCWYEAETKPSDYLIVLRDNKYYKVPFGNDLDRLVRDETYLATKTNYETIFLVEPMKKYETEFGNDPAFKRDDGMYEWIVDDERKIRLSHVAGVSNKKVFTKYLLMYRTLPDHQIVEFVPSVGITHFIYSHHGTVSDVDLKLIEFRKK